MPVPVPMPRAIVAGEGDPQMKALTMCLNWKVIAALAVVASGIALAAPGLLVAALPLLFLAACPLSMLLMMRGMGGMGSSHAMPYPTPADTANRAGAESLADLKARLVRVQAEQQSLAASVAQMEQRAPVDADAAPLPAAR